MNVGIDIVHISRIESLDEYALKKIFHPSELLRKDALHLAGIFAVKESCKKIFQGSDWLDFEVIKEKTGKPKLHTIHDFKGDLSISHDGEYAIAVVFHQG